MFQHLLPPYLSGGTDCIFLMAATWLFPPLSFGPCNLIMAPVPRAQRCYWVCPAPAGSSDLCPSPYQLQLRGTKKQQSSPGDRSGIRQLWRRMLSSALAKPSTRWTLWCHCPHAVPPSAVPWGNLTPALWGASDSSIPCGRILLASCLGHWQGKQGGKWLAELQALSGAGGV